MRYLILDLETLPISNAVDFLPVSDIKPDGRLKDPEKIAADIAAQQKDLIGKAALDLDLARICAFGFGKPGHLELATSNLVRGDGDEADELRNLAMMLDPLNGGIVTLVTFNGHKYDLPLLMRRAKYLGVPFPRLNLDRYRSPHIDLYDELTMKGAIKAHSLRWYMRRHGWTDLLDADPLKNGGADVATACQENRWDDIAAHVRVDVLGTLRLAAWMGVLPASVPETAGAF